MRTHVDIVIPHYGEGHLVELCLACLRSIRAAAVVSMSTTVLPVPYRILFVDNGSAELGRLEEELALHPHVLIRNTTNVGFIKAVNAGIKLSSAPYVVLLNNDTEVVPGWLNQLQAPFALNRSVGLSGPLTTTEGSWQGRWQVRGGPVHILGAGRMLAFFCVMIGRSVLEKVGLLDESYGVGFGDDDDYCRRAERAGFRMALVQDLRIPHHHRSTFRALYPDEEIKRMQDEALRKFKCSV